WLDDGEGRLTEPSDAQIAANAAAEAVEVLRATLSQAAALDVRLPHVGTGTGNGAEDAALWQRRIMHVGWILAAAPHAGIPAGVIVDDPGLPGYQDVVIVDLPTGQVSWRVPTG